MWSLGLSLQLCKGQSLYQLNDDEMLGPATAAAMLTSNDWGVLNLVMPCHLQGHKLVMDEKQYVVSNIISVRLESADIKLTQRKIIFSPLWWLR